MTSSNKTTAATNPQSDGQKIALITGASRGIGAASALAAANLGYDIALNYASNQKAAQEVADQVRALGRQAIVLQADIGNETEVIRLFESVDKQLGRLTALVNNAGILETHSRVDAMSVERWQRVFRINVFGCFMCAKEAVKRMSSLYGGSGGSIVNISSVASRLGSPFEYVDYAASKGAVDALTLGLAKEVAPEGIRVNAVRPGLIYTDIHASGGEPNRVDRLSNLIPMKRGGSAQEVADAVAWLLSDQSAYVTGTTIDVSGGR
jgi:NAD(P)-dependent dehydrogenase (short-subunit alcohol dehydrogenase family)